MRATEYFHNNDILGMVLTNVQEVLKAHDLGLSIMTENEDYLDERYDEETGSYRKATTDEIIEDAQVAFKAADKLYATLDTPIGYMVVPNKRTNLQTDFYVGQEVYTMKDNKVAKVKIEYLSLAPENILMNKQFKDAYLEETAKRLYFNIGCKFKPCGIESPSDQSIDEISKLIKKYCLSNFAIVSLGAYGEMRNVSEVFATKEELVKHLMEE